jgi:hypothetical protein
MSRFRLIFGVLFVSAGSLAANESTALLRAAAESNVNQRYTIESVAISGSEIDHTHIPSALHRRLLSLVGAHYDVGEIDDLASQLKRDLHLKDVVGRVSRGSAPDRVRLNFETTRRNMVFDLSVPRFLYHSAQGWSGEAVAGIRIKQTQSLSLGVVSNGNDFVERATGATLRAEDASLDDGHIRLGLSVQALHSEWNPETRTALHLDGRDNELYRSRRNVSSGITFDVARPLTISFGTTFEQMEGWGTQPLRSANGFTGEIRYKRADEGSQLEARYVFRAGTHALGSDYSYTKSLVSFRYQRKWGRQTAADEFTAGAISGNAPLFEQFVLGNNSTLRGWDRYQIDPAGGNRVVHNSLSWGYRTGEGTIETFYDSGVLWHDNRSAPVRHSVGVGYRQGIFGLCVAFPLVEGRITPVFIAGMNY